MGIDRSSRAFSTVKVKVEAIFDKSDQRSLKTCPYMHHLLLAEGPVTLCQNRTILHRRISSHRLHRGHTVVVGQARCDSSSSVAGNVTVSTGLILVRCRR